MRVQDPFEQHLDAPAAVLAAEKPRRDDARVVEYQEITRAQERGEVPKAVIGDRATVPVEVQEAGLAACGGRVLSDEVLGQGVSEVAALHRAMINDAPPASAIDFRAAVSYTARLGPRWRNW